MILIRNSFSWNSFIFWHLHKNLGWLAGRWKWILHQGFCVVQICFLCFLLSTHLFTHSYVCFSCCPGGSCVTSTCTSRYLRPVLRSFSTWPTAAWKRVCSHFCIFGLCLDLLGQTASGIVQFMLILTWHESTPYTNVLGFFFCDATGLEINRLSSTHNKAVFCLLFNIDTISQFLFTAVLLY